MEDHSKGETYVPTELESIMFGEIMDIIIKKYDHKDGLAQLTVLLKKQQTSKSG